MSERNTMLTTKERILDAAESLMLEKSFHSVGLNEILAAVKVPKGSFYHHFESKEQFGVEMLRHYVAAEYQREAAWLHDKTQFPQALERMVRFLEAGLMKFVENGCRPICLVVKLCGEVATFSTGMRQELHEGFSKWDALLADTIREGQEQGCMKAALDPDVTAALLGQLWLGAMLQAQVQKNVNPLARAVTFMKTYLAV